MNLHQITTEWINDFIGLIYPNVCYSCGQRLIKTEEVVCLECLHALPRTFFHKDHTNPVSQRFAGRIPFEEAAAIYFFAKKGRLQKLIHLLKYKNKYEVGLRLGQEIGRIIWQEPSWHKADYLIPIPLHPKKIKKRGYNQSMALAEGISDKTDLTVLRNVVGRRIHNVSQTKKTSVQGRWENVKDIFEVKNIQGLTGKHLLIVDDVITTGATMEACAMHLTKNIPNVKISFLAVACAEII